MAGSDKVFFQNVSLMTICVKNYALVNISCVIFFTHVTLFKVFSRKQKISLKTTFSKCIKSGNKEIRIMLQSNIPELFYPLLGLKVFINLIKKFTIKCKNEESKLKIFFVYYLSLLTKNFVQSSFIIMDEKKFINYSL